MFHANIFDRGFLGFFFIYVSSHKRINWQFLKNFFVICSFSKSEYLVPFWILARTFLLTHTKSPSVHLFVVVVYLGPFCPEIPVLTIGHDFDWPEKILLLADDRNRAFDGRTWSGSRYLLCQSPFVPMTRLIFFLEQSLFNYRLLSQVEKVRISCRHSR